MTVHRGKAQRRREKGPMPTCKRHRKKRGRKTDFLVEGSL